MKAQAYERWKHSFADSKTSPSCGGSKPIRVEALRYVLDLPVQIGRAERVGNKNRAFVGHLEAPIPRLAPARLLEP
jgi:hypothetical protein